MRINIPLISVGLLLLSIIFLALPSASAGLGTFEQDECVHIKTILNTSFVNISTISYPNSSIAVSNQMMTKSGLSFNYTFCDTSSLGIYIYDYFDAEGYGYVNDFEITANGNPVPSGVIVVIFSIFFIILIGLSGYFILYTLGHFVKLDFDIIDLAIDFGIFFMILSFYYLETYYLANPFIDNLHIVILSVYGVLFLLVPSIAFILSIAIGALNPNQKMRIAVPRKMRIGR